MTQKINSLNDESNLLSDKLSALFSIYSKDNKDSKKMGTIIRKIANILNEINDKKISIKKRETYMEKGFEIHDELLNQIYDLIRDMQIDYRV